MKCLRLGTGAGALLAVAGAASGQAFTADFEAPAYAGSPTGTILTGQNGWYLPPVVNTVDGFVFTYAGSTPAIPPHPSGGAQCAVGRSGVPTGTVLELPRMQHAVNFSAGGVWEVSYDCAAFWNAPLPTIDFLGSFSLQDSVTSTYFQTILTWGSPQANVIAPPWQTPVNNHTTTGTNFHIGIGRFTETSPTSIAFEFPSAAWNDLDVTHWYRVKVRWDFDTRSLLSASIQDLTAGTPPDVTDLSGLGWVLQGGMGLAGSYALPTDIRLFSGAGAPENVTCWDNLAVEPVSGGSACYANCDGSTTIPFLNVNDFVCFQQAFAAGDPYANCDGSTTAPVLNVNDFVCFQQAFAAGCSAP